MNINKKILACIFAVSLLCGCSANNGKIPNNTNSNKSQTTTENSKGKTTGIPTVTDDNTTTPPIKNVASIADYSTKKVVWGPGNITDHQVPQDPKSLESTFKNLNAKWLLSDEKSIALTFDEGYENGFTPAILDTLKEKKVKAIFFVTYDFAKDNPDIIKRMIDEGHVVGNHSYHHYSMDEVDLSTGHEEVMFLHNYMKEKYNYTMSYFRFPKGEFSQQSLGLVNSLKYKSVFWSFAYADWDPNSQPNEDEAFTRITQSTHPGAIFLLHAVSKTNADILGKVIDDLQHQGYTFTTDIK